MSLNLARISTRLSSKLVSLRQISMIAPRVLVAQNQSNSFKQNTKLIKINQTNTIGLVVRGYASQEKLTQTQIQEKVLDILKNFDRVKENPAKPQVSLESHLMKDLGLDSLDQVEIIVQLEDAFGYEIPDSDYEKLITPKEIVNYIQKRLAEV